MATDINVVKVQFDIDSKDISKAQTEYESMVKSIDKTKLSVEQLTNSLDKENRKVTESKEKLREISRDYQNLTAEIKRTGSATKEQSEKQAKLSREFKDTTEKFKDATLNAKKLNEQLKGNSQQTEQFSNKLKGLGGMVAGAFAVGSVLAFGKAILDATRNNETFIMSLSAMLNNKQQAEILNAELIRLAKETPFSLEEMQQSTRSLIAMGVASTDISKTLTTLSDVAAGTGNSITELADKFGRFKTQGRLYQQDVNELTGRGIPVIQEFAKQFGVAEGEVRKLIEAGKIGFPEVQKALESMTSEGGKFFELSKQLATTTTGQLSALGDSWNQLLVKMGNSTTGFVNFTLKSFNFLLGGITGLFDTVESDAQDKSAVLIEKSGEKYKNIYDKAIELAKKSNKDLKAELTNTETQLLDENLIKIKQAEEKLKAIEKDFQEVKNTNEKLSNANNSRRYDRLDNRGLLDNTNYLVTENDLSTLSTGTNYVDAYINQLAELNKLKAETGVINEQYNASLKEVEKTESDATKNREDRLKKEKNTFKEELALLKLREDAQQRVNSRMFDKDESSLAKLKTEEEYNNKRILLYEKYGYLLESTDKQTLKGFITRKEEFGIDILILENEIWDKRINNYLAREEEFAKIDAERTDANNAEVLAKYRQVEIEDLTAIYRERNEKLKGLKGKEYQEVFEAYEKKIEEATKYHNDKKLDLELVQLQRKKELGDDSLALTNKIKDKELEIEREKNKQIELETEKSEAKKLAERQKAMALLSQIGQTALTLLKENANQEFQIQKDKLDAERDYELSNKNLTESEKDAINRKYKKLEYDIKVREFNFNKTIALSEIAINTAINAVKVGTNPLLLGLVIGLGALQAGVVAQRQPPQPPKFFKGTDYLNLNGNPKGIDTIPVLAHEGERIVPTAINEELKGIKNKDLPMLVNLGKLVRNGGINLGKSNQPLVVNVDNKELVNEFKKIPISNISFDENGFKTFIKKQNRTTEILNKRYGGL